MTAPFDTQYAIFFCDSSYNFGFGETRPYVEEKFTIELVLFFFANSLQTENNAVTFVSR